MLNKTSYDNYIGVEFGKMVVELLDKDFIKKNRKVSKEFCIEFINKINNKKGN